MKKSKWLKVSLLTFSVIGAILAGEKVANASIYSKTADIQGVVYGSNMFEEDWANHIIQPGYNSSSLAQASALQSLQSAKSSWELNNSTGTNQTKNQIDLYPNSKRTNNFDITKDLYTTTRYKSSWSAYNDHNSTTRTVVPTNYNLSLSQTINTVQSDITAIDDVKVYRMNVSDYNALDKNKADNQIDVSKAEDITNESWVKKYYGNNVADKGYEKTSKENKLSSWSVSRQVIVNLDLKNAPEYKEFWKNHSYDKAYEQNHSDNKFKDSSDYPKEDYVYFVQTKQHFTDKTLVNNTQKSANTSQNTTILGGSSKTAIKTNDGFDVSATSWQAGSTQNTAPWSDYKSNGTYLATIGDTQTVSSGIKNVTAQKRVSFSTTMNALNAVPLLQNLMPALTYTTVYDDTNEVQNLASDQIKFTSDPLSEGQNYTTTDKDFSDSNRQGKTQINGSYGYILHAYAPAIYKDKLAKDPQQAVKDAKVVMNTSANPNIDVDTANAKFMHISTKTGKLTTDMSDLTTDADIYIYVPAKVKDVTKDNYDSVVASLDSNKGNFTTSFSVTSLNYYSKDVTVNIPKASMTTSYYKYGTAPDAKADGYTGNAQYVANPDEVKPTNSQVYVGIKASIINTKPASLKGWTYANQSSKFDDDTRFSEDGSYEQWFSYKRVYTTRIQKIAQYSMHKYKDNGQISKTNPLIGSVDVILATDTETWDGYSLFKDKDITYDGGVINYNNRYRTINAMSVINSKDVNFVSNTNAQSSSLLATVANNDRTYASDTKDGVTTTYSAVRSSISRTTGSEFSKIDFNLSDDTSYDHTSELNSHWNRQPWVEFKVDKSTYQVANPIADTNADSSKTNNYSYSANSSNTENIPVQRNVLFNKDGSVHSIKTYDETHETQSQITSTNNINSGDVVKLNVNTLVTSYGNFSSNRLTDISGYATSGSAGKYGGTTVFGKIQSGYNGSASYAWGFGDLESNTWRTTQALKLSDVNPTSSDLAVDHDTMYRRNVTSSGTSDLFGLVKNKDQLLARYDKMFFNTDELKLSNLLVNTLKSFGSTVYGLAGSANLSNTSTDLSYGNITMWQVKDARLSAGDYDKADNYSDNSIDKTLGSDMLWTYLGKDKNGNKVWRDDESGEVTDSTHYSQPLQGIITLSQATSNDSTRARYTYINNTTFNRSVVDKGLKATQTFGSDVQPTSSQRLSTGGSVITPSMLDTNQPAQIKFTFGAKSNRNYFLGNPKFTITANNTLKSTRFPAVNSSDFVKTNSSITFEPTNKALINSDSKLKDYKDFYNSK